LKRSFWVEAREEWKICGEKGERGLALEELRANLSHKTIGERVQTS